MTQRGEVHGDTIGGDHVLDGGEHAADVFDNAVGSRRVFPGAHHRRPRRRWCREVKLVGVVSRKVMGGRNVPSHHDFQVREEVGV